MGKGDGQGSDVNNNLKKNDQIQQLVNKVIRYGNVQAICDILYNLQTIESKEGQLEFSGRFPMHIAK